METLPPLLQDILEAAGDRDRAAQLLLEALTHRTFLNEQRFVTTADNQRLELLGDAVLELIVTHELFREMPEADEGLLSRARASVVNEGALSTAARAVGLGPALRLGRGEAAGGGRDRPRILADALEAVVAAIYLAAGLDVARTFVLQALRAAIDEVVRETVSSPTSSAGVDARAKDAKSVLQEMLQRGGGDPPSYTLESTEGPVHDRSFRVSVVARGIVLGSGQGRSRREAEMRAAAEAVAALERDPSMLGPS